MNKRRGIILGIVVALLSITIGVLLFPTIYYRWFDQRNTISKVTVIEAVKSSHTIESILQTLGAETMVTNFEKEEMSSAVKESVINVALNELSQMKLIDSTVLASIIQEGECTITVSQKGISDMAVKDMESIVLWEILIYADNYSCSIGMDVESYKIVALDVINRVGMDHLIFENDFKTAISSLCNYWNVGYEIMTQGSNTRYAKIHNSDCNLYFTNAPYEITFFISQAVVTNK